MIWLTLVWRWSMGEDRKDGESDKARVFGRSRARHLGNLCLCHTYISRCLSHLSLRLGSLDALHDINIVRILLTIKVWILVKSKVCPSKL
jgi:hypothetical protein